MSIRTKLTILLILLSCIPLAFFGILSLSNFSNSLINGHTDHLLADARFYEYRIKERLMSGVGSMSMLTENDFAEILDEEVSLTDRTKVGLLAETAAGLEIVYLSRITTQEAREIVAGYNLGKVSEGKMFAHQNDGELDYLMIYPFQDQPYKLIVGVNDDEILKPVAMLGRTLLTIIIITLLFVSILALITAKNVADPILGLVRYTKQIKQNIKAEPLELGTEDELSELNDSFNSLIEQLRDNQENLEQRVDSRTFELESSKKALLNMMEDLSDEKQRTEVQAQELLKFKQAVEAASDQILITDSEGIVLYANPVMEELTGFSREETLGKKAGSLWGGLMPKEYFQKMWQTIKVKKSVFTDEIRNQRKTGEQYIALIKISPVLDEVGELKFFVAIERDITHEKEIDKAKTEFVSLASHQLRTPLSIIRWYIDSLIQGKGGAAMPEGRSLEFLQAIRESNIRMIELVGALLNVSRLELGTFAVNPEPVRIYELVHSIVSEFQPLIDEKQQHCQVNVDHNLPVMAVDKNLMAIIIQNLVSNAIKYSPNQGSIQINLRSEQNKFVLEVIDSGYGIPPEQQKNVFTKLFRADNVKKKDVVGTGLGLYLVKSILDAVGGEINFESVENLGTTFRVFIPITGMRAKLGTKQLEWNERTFKEE